MKYIKFLAIAIMAVIAFASCDSDQEGVIHQPLGESISYAQKASSFLFDDAEATVQIRMVRSQKVGEYTAHYSLVSNQANVFTDLNNGTVTFADGQTVAYVSVKASNMEGGKTYKATLKLSDTDINTTDTITNSAIHAHALSIKRDYVWAPYGRGYYIDGNFNAFFGVDNSLWYAVDIETAADEDGTVLYRFDSPFAYVCSGEDELGGLIGYPYNEEGDCDNSSHKFVISLLPNEEGSTENNAAFDNVTLGLDYGYGSVTISQASSKKYGTYDLTTGTIHFKPGILKCNMGTQYSADAPSDTYLFLNGDALEVYLNAQ